MSSSHLEVVWRQWDFYEKEETTQLMFDVRWAAGSFLFVFIFMWAATGSLVVTTGGMVGVMLSFPVALFLYVVGCHVRWVGLLNFLGLFLITGIGADDIFVVWEHWKQAPVQGDRVEDRIFRMAWTLHRSATAMAATSFTTAAVDGWLNACEFLHQVQPTDQELINLARVPRGTLPSGCCSMRDCNKVDMTRVHANLLGGATIQAWAKRLGKRSYAKPLELLVDRWFGKSAPGSPERQLESNVTRLAFRLNDSKATDDFVAAAGAHIGKHQHKDDAGTVGSDEAPAYSVRYHPISEAGMSSAEPAVMASITAATVVYALATLVEVNSLLFSVVCIRVSIFRKCIEQIRKKVMVNFACTSAARLYVKFPEFSAIACLVLVASLCGILVKQEITLDTGIKAFHTRHTAISDHDTSTALASMWLDTFPTGHAKRDHRFNWQDRGLDGEWNGRQELHVLFRAKDGDVMDPEHLQTLHSNGSQVLCAMSDGICDEDSCDDTCM
eukprot:gene30621-38316_t